MPLKSKSEIRALVDFLFRQLFSLLKYWLKRGYGEDTTRRLMEDHLRLSLGVLQRTRFTTGYLDYSQPSDAELLHHSHLKFTEQFDAFCTDWYQIHSAGYPTVLVLAKTHLAITSRIDQITDFIYLLYRNQQSVHAN